MSLLFVTELFEERSGLALEVGELFGCEVLSESADGFRVRAGQRLARRLRRDSEVLGDRLVRVCKRLVADLERPLTCGARGGYVPAPGPGRARRVARPLEFLGTPWLDPE